MLFATTYCSLPSCYSNYSCTLHHFNMWRLKEKKLQHVKFEQKKCRHDYIFKLKVKSYADFFSLQVDSSQFRTNQSGKWMWPGSPFHNRQWNVSEQEKLACNYQFYWCCIQLWCSRAMALCTLTHWHGLLGYLNIMDPSLLVLLWHLFFLGVGFKKSPCFQHHGEYRVRESWVKCLTNQATNTLPIR